MNLGRVTISLPLWLLTLGLTSFETPIASLADDTNSTNVTVLLRLPELDSNDLPSTQFIDLVNSAFKSIRSTGDSTLIQVVSRSTTSRICARVILLSYGLKMSSIAMSDSMESTSFRSGNKTVIVDGTDQTRGSKSSANKSTAVVQPAKGSPSKRVALIVLGNAPLDASTPTVDLIKRVLKAVEYAQANPQSILVLTGGRTAGPVSEARMMAIIALSRGITRDRIFLEEEARGTSANAKLTKGIIASHPVDEILIVSKQSHLEWAMHIFQQEGEPFTHAKPLPCEVTNQEIIQQMQEYLRVNDNDRVRYRMQELMQGHSGVD